MLGTVDETQLDDAEEQRHLAQLGEIIKQERVRLGLTAEQAAKEARVAYKTWLRVESGQPVRNLTWGGVDRLFSLPPGTALRAKNIEWGLNLRYEIQKGVTGRTVPHGAGTAKLPPPSNKDRTAHETYDFSRPILSWEGYDDRVIATTPLEKRLLGLDLDSLRRLRDMVDGAIAAYVKSERDNLLQHISQAQDALTAARHRRMELTGAAESARNTGDRDLMEKLDSMARQALEAEQHAAYSFYNARTQLDKLEPKEADPAERHATRLQNRITATRASATDWVHTIIDAANAGDKEKVNRARAGLQTAEQNMKDLVEEYTQLIEANPHLGDQFRNLEINTRLPTVELDGERGENAKHGEAAER